MQKLRAGPPLLQSPGEASGTVLHQLPACLTSSGLATCQQRTQEALASSLSRFLTDSKWPPSGPE